MSHFFVMLTSWDSKTGFSSLRLPPVTGFVGATPPKSVGNFPLHLHLHLHLPVNLPFTLDIPLSAQARQHGDDALQ